MVVVMIVQLTFHQIDSRRTIHDRYLRVVLRQAFAPCLLKPQVAHTEVDGTFSQIYHYGGGWFISLGTGTGGYKRIDTIITAHQLFQEVALRLYGDGEEWFLRLTLVFGSIAAGNSQ